MTHRISSANAETDKRSVARKLLKQVVERWHAGASVPDARKVLAENPQLSQVKSVVVDLAYEEYCFRRDAGEKIDREEFCSQFPEYQSSICRRLEVHEFFSAEPMFPAPGQRILGLHLIDELGRGALARVYLAEEMELGGRLVAVKFAQYGQYEADFLGRLQHPNIVPVHSVKFDESTGLSAVVMPYLGDKTLADINISSAEQALHVFAQLADALAYTHSQQILHRDLKPSNVLMGERPMLMDFNLSADVTDDLKRVGGTVQYMAPEQRAQLEDGQTNIDGRADIYSLGVMLDEALPSASLTRPIRDIVRQCTAVNPDHRFASAELLAKALWGQLRPLPRVKRWVRKKPLQATALVMSLMVAFAIGGAYYATRPTLLQRASQLVNEGRADEAVDLLLTIDDKTAEVLLALGEARLANNDAEGAYKNFDDALKLSSTGELAARIGYVACLVPYSNEICRFWHERAREAGFDSPELQNNEAHCLRRQGKNLEAKAELERALSVDPNLKPAILNLALVNFQLALAGDGDVTRDIFANALAHCDANYVLHQGAALAILKSSTVSDADTADALYHIEKSLGLGASVDSTRKSFDMLKGNARFEVLLQQSWNVPKVAPKFVIDPKIDQAVAAE